MITSEQIDALWTIDGAVEGYEKLIQTLSEHPDSADEIHTQICRSLAVQRKFAEGWEELAKVSANPTPIVSIRVQLESGRLKNSSGDKAGAAPFFHRAFDLAVEGKFDFYAVDAAHMLGIVTSGQESVDWNERALALAAASSDPRARKWKGSLLNNLGWTYHDAGDYAKALEKFEAALEFRREVGEPRSIYIARWMVARCYRSLGRYDDALAILEELAQGAEDGYVSEELGENLLALGRAEESKPRFQRAYELLSQDGYLVAHEPERLNRLKQLAG